MAVHIGLVSGALIGSFAAQLVHRSVGCPYGGGLRCPMNYLNPIAGAMIGMLVGTVGVF